MTDTLNRVSQLRRPRLLIRAARHGLADYCRNRVIDRLPDFPGGTDERQVLEALIDAEQSLEATRQRGDAGYSVARHVELLIAVMAEARLLLARARPV